VNIDWSRILSEFARLLKELRIGEEEGICTIHKFILHCNCSKTLRLLSPVNHLESIPEDKVTGYTLSGRRPPFPDPRF